MSVKRVGSFLRLFIYLATTGKFLLGFLEFFRAFIASFAFDLRTRFSFISHNISPFYPFLLKRAGMELVATRLPVRPAAFNVQNARFGIAGRRNDPDNIHPSSEAHTFELQYL